MATVTYTLGEKHSKSGFGGGFAHELGKADGFSKAYGFGRVDGAMKPADITYSHEVTGDDLKLFQAMLDDGRLAKSEFHIADKAAAAGQ